MASTPVESPALDATCARFARALEDRVDELVLEGLALMQGSLSEWLSEPPVRDQLIAFARDSETLAFRALAAGGDLPDACPPPDAWVAEQSAEFGTPLSVLLDGYRVGQQVQTNAWTALVDEADLDPELARAMRRRGVDFFFAYHRRVTALVTDLYVRERDRRLLNTEERRMSEMRLVLEGEKDEFDPRVVDYPLHGSHLAIVATGAELKDALRATARTLDCRCLVVDAIPREPWWAWVGRSRPLADGTAAVIRELCETQGALAGIGTERARVEGFRESTRQALAAFRGAREGRPVVAYSQVAMEDLASRDSEAARAFVAAELAPLGDGDRRTERLRETLAAYFDCGQNARATATRLGIHHQTVGQRLAAIEERIGQPVGERRAELELALRLHRYL